MKFSVPKNAPAFTLMEMVIAITVFTVFIGFSVSTFVRFYQVEKEAAATRTLLLETQSILESIKQDLAENKIDYAYYNGGFSADLLGVSQNAPTVARFTSELVLRSPDGSVQTRYIWDSFTESLTLQRLDKNGQPFPGYFEPLVLEGPYTDVTHVLFRIFPADNPFDSANVSKDGLQFQPNVQIELETQVPSPAGSVPISIDFQTSVTSRFYQ